MNYSQLMEILLSEKPSDKLRERKEEVFKLIPELEVCDGYDQETIWHPYDVYEHTLRVIDGVDNNFDLRIAALFHDIGKPYCKTIDEKGERHYYGHWNKSKDIFIKYRNRLFLGLKDFNLICKLIEYHDLSIQPSSIRTFVREFSEDEIESLYKLKEADIKAQNMDFAERRLNNLEKQKKIFAFAMEAVKEGQYSKNGE